MSHVAQTLGADLPSFSLTRSTILGRRHRSTGADALLAQYDAAGAIDAAADALLDQLAAEQIGPLDNLHPDPERDYAAWDQQHVGDRFE